MLHLLAALVVAATAGPPPGAFASAADELVARAANGLEPGAIALAVMSPGGEPLRQVTETALAGRLAGRGHSVLPLTGPRLDDAEAAARGLGADFLLRVRVALIGPSLVLSGELIPTRPNFFLQRAPAVRGAGSRTTAVSVPADEVARSVAAAARAPGHGPITLRPLVDLGQPVLAIAAGVTAAGAVRVVAVTPAALLLLDARGAQLATLPLPPAAGPRVRDPAAVAVVADLGGPGRIGFALADRPGGEVLSAEGDRLERVGTLSAAPLAACGKAMLFGAFVPGRGALQDVLGLRAEPLPAPRSAGQLVAVAAAPHADPCLFGALDSEYVLHLLGPGLEPVAPPLPGVGAGFALADLDGDGELEVVASEPSPEGERVRVLRPWRQVETLFESPIVAGALVAGAVADLTGDGLDDALLAATLAGGGTRLWLVTADSRGAGR